MKWRSFATATAPVYFADYDAAKDFGATHGKGFPAWRVVEHANGFAIQIRPGGDYLAADGLPTLTDRSSADSK